MIQIPMKSSADNSPDGKGISGRAFKVSYKKLEVCELIWTFVLIGSALQSNAICLSF